MAIFPVLYTQYILVLIYFIRTSLYLLIPYPKLDLPPPLSSLLTTGSVNLFLFCYIYLYYFSISPIIDVMYICFSLLFH